VPEVNGFCPQKDEHQMAAQWYVLRSKPRKEEIVWRQAQARGIEVFFPRLRVNPVNPRARKLRPYFPGYMFVQVDIEEVGLSLFRWMPHAIGLVTFGGEPARVPENLIYAIRRKLEAIAAAGGEVLEGLKPGDAVRIHSGPFAGYEAIFDARLPGAERVRVLLKMLSDRRVQVELSAGQVRKIEKRRRRSTR
jgi:transcriptional antiterminator RfaH